MKFTLLNENSICACFNLISINTIAFTLVYIPFISAFGFKVIRLSKTSDYLLGQVKHPLAVIRRTSENLQPYFRCRGGIYVTIFGQVTTVTDESVF